MRNLAYTQAIAAARERQLDLTRNISICVVCEWQEATAPHHWLFPQGNNAPDEVQNDLRNICLLCQPCHDKAHHTGQPLKPAIVISPAAMTCKAGWTTWSSGRSFESDPKHCRFVTGPKSGGYWPISRLFTWPISGPFIVRLIREMT